MGLLAYLRAGGPIKGAAAARYAYERAIAEGLLAIRLMDQRMTNGNQQSAAAAGETCTDNITGTESSSVTNPPGITS
jgi:hypothetical protein